MATSTKTKSMNTQLTSISAACRLFHLLPHEILAASAKLGIEPELVLDGKPFFSPSDLEKLRDHLRAQQLSGCGLAARANNLS